MPSRVSGLTSNKPRRVENLKHEKQGDLHKASLSILEKRIAGEKKKKKKRRRKREKREQSEKPENQARTNTLFRVPFLS